MLAARPTGFALSFVLKTPDPRELRLQAEMLKSGPNGTVTAGQVSGGPVDMRDATGRTAHAVRSVRAGGLTIRPAQAMLDAAWTRYPVAVTQEFSADTLSWMVVGQSVTGQGYLSQWRPQGTVTAGVSGEYDYRAYVELTAVPVHGKHIRRATLRTQTCQDVEAWHIGPFGPATTWTQTEYRELIGVTDCGDVDVTALMARAAAEGWQRISVAFAARKNQQPARITAPLVEVQYR